MGVWGPYGVLKGVWGPYGVLMGVWGPYGVMVPQRPLQNHDQRRRERGRAQRRRSLWGPYGVLMGSFWGYGVPMESLWECGVSMG